MKCGLSRSRRASHTCHGTVGSLASWLLPPQRASRACDRHPAGQRPLAGRFQLRHRARTRKVRWTDL